MQRGGPGRIARCATALGALAIAACLPATGAARADELAPLGPPLVSPLDRPLEIRGGFGEPRSNHLHAGFDLSTGGVAGSPVHAGAAGWVERVRASGVGYGRSVYVRTGDGRLLVYGHLDAFAPALAAYVDSAQRATGDYEQDLWPAAHRFVVAAGERLGWSGRSGTGTPHLHMEIRHGDFALDPLRAGLRVADASPPRLVSLVIEPLDEASWVARGAAPLVHALGRGGDTLLVEGRVRIAVRATDPGPGAEDLPPWSVGARWDDHAIEARFDSLSWADDMTQLDLVWDRGRIAGSGAIGLWAPARFRPRVLRCDEPDSLEAGVIVVRPGDPARPLALWARDVAGHEADRTVWLRGPRAGERGPDTTRVGTRSALREPRWSFASLPGHRLRVRLEGAPEGVHGVRVERANTRAGGGASQAATWDGHAWTAVVDAEGLPDLDGLWIKGTGRDGRTWWLRGTYALWPAGSPMMIQPEPGYETGLGIGQVFEPSIVATRLVPTTGVPAGSAAVTSTMQVLPPALPVRHPIPLVMSLPAGASHEHVGLYHRLETSDEWEWADARWDSAAHAIVAEVSRTGEFTLLRDDAPPVVSVAAPPRRWSGTPYPHWALVAHAADRGSGVDARASAFVVDGTRVPCEWDGVRGELRWRPNAAPAAGRHEWRVEIVDRSGNRAGTSGTFVLDSSSR